MRAPRRIISALLPAGLWAAAILIAGCSNPSDQLDSQDAAKRFEAIHYLGGHGDAASVARLGQATEHKDPRTAREAVWALGRAADASASEALHRVLKTDKRAEVRQVAVMALRRRLESDSRQVLRDVARTDPDGAVRAEAAAAVGAVGTLDDVPFLADLAAADPSVPVQSRAVGAIETLTGYRFPYDSRASEEQRRAALERLKEDACRIAAFQRRFAQQEAGR